FASARRDFADAQLVQELQGGSKRIVHATNALAHNLCWRAWGNAPKVPSVAKIFWLSRIGNPLAKNRMFQYSRNLRPQFSPRFVLELAANTAHGCHQRRIGR